MSKVYLLKVTKEMWLIGIYLGSVGNQNSKINPQHFYNFLPFDFKAPNYIECIFTI